MGPDGGSPLPGWKLALRVSAAKNAYLLTLHSEARGAYNSFASDQHGVIYLGALHGEPAWPGTCVAAKEAASSVGLRALDPSLVPRRVPSRLASAARRAAFVLVAARPQKTAPLDCNCDVGNCSEVAQR